MKNTTLSAIFLFLLILFFNCSDDNPDNNQPDDVLSLSVENISFDALGEKKSFKITSNSKWEIEKKSSGSWYTVTPNSGEGVAEITIDADENLEYSMLITYYLF
ncbi:BACON domain-containing protein [Dysgonomonas sp. BGC7]|uniref:BACON domain-containing protein n=1 Tax=Dysgonomonas sp. BGC7 TaxID=1658008 RepID=UPI000680AD65|nr:BACON domain-containing protein [Dysgonomonas sp. BGC7]MBD8390371.1 BACON domain-containing protein [Dysgonomonas sp. BGC7]